MFYQTFTGLRLPGSTPVFRFHPRSFFLLVLSALLSVVSLKAATLPSGFTESMVAGGISSPTAMSFAPDGRLFVCQQTGQLRVIKNGSLLASPFLTVTVDSAGERGLLGIAFDPNFASNQFVYIYYTVPGAPPHNRVSRFTANGDVVLAGSELPLLELNNLSSATNHNGGALHFGLDGKLYIAVGENANSANSQTLTNLLGKILRLNSDGTIPNDNPFFNQATGSNRAIWALGLRNPFTFAVQPGSGRSFINDVGQSAREEINLGVAGSNYGWPTCEGPCTPANPNFRDPLYFYTHATSNTQGCAITGGTFSSTSSLQFPGTYAGKYFFAEFCSGWINYLDPDNPATSNSASVFATGLSSPVDLQTGPDGSLYYLQRGGTGEVWRIKYTATYDTDGDGIPDQIEANEGTNPNVKDNDVFNNARLFVMQQYRDFLRREGEANGVSSWVGALNSGTLTHAEVIDAFFSSAEFQQIDPPVARIYLGPLRQIPDYDGQRYRAGRLKGGTPLNNIGQEFTSTPAFLALYSGLNNDDYVTRLYQNVLGRAPDSAGFAYWTGQLNSGAGRGDVMVKFSESAEYQAAGLNKTAVALMYIAMLQRTAEPAGFDAWNAFLNGGATRLNLIQAFFSAPEYHNRFLP